MKKIDQIIGLIFLIFGIIFLVHEFITLSAANIPLWNAYITKTISRLAVPYGTIYRGVLDTLSPKGYLLNITFILSGIILFIGNIFSVQKYISKYKAIFIILTILTSIGLILIALNPTGGSTTDLTHEIAATIVFVSGTFLLIVTGLAINNQPTYKKICLILGVIAFISGLLFISIKSDLNYPFRGLFERGIIYSILMWIFITGYYLVKKRFEK